VARGVVLLKEHEAVAGPTPPRLENGDRLTRHEFHRRYLAMPQLTKADLIEGIVYLTPRVRFSAHAKPHAILTAWLGHFAAFTPGLDVFGCNCTVRLDEENEPQPDLLLLLPPMLGGRAVVDHDDFVAGAPELVCEVASSSVSVELHAKLNAYRRNGVREYLVWRTQDGAIDWFRMNEGVYVAMQPADGLLKSQIFPGLWLDPAALLAGDLSRLFAVLEQGAATPNHAAFVASLKTP
jgi:Uma2 family endonuclease